MKSVNEIQQSLYEHLADRFHNRVVDKELKDEVCSFVMSFLGKELPARVPVVGVESNGHLLDIKFYDLKGEELKTYDQLVAFLGGHQ